MSEMEEWVDIRGYEGLYQVSNFGRVRSIDRGMVVVQDRYSKPFYRKRKGRVLNQYLDGKGYPMVRPCKLGKSATLTVHRLVAIHFINNPSDKPTVNHIDSNPLNNHVSNLEWCTYGENNRHAISYGNRKNMKGTRHIKIDEAIAIKKLLKEGLACRAVANLIGTSYGVVKNISRGATWRHI